ncbi:MAG: hypothetical protein PHF97_12470 [Bacteroidales bacterium]|nr:hypothetical protein [Bacteroidales bacterium]
MKELSDILKSSSEFEEEANQIFGTKKALSNYERHRMKFELAIISASLDEFDKMKSLLIDCHEFNIQNDSQIFYSGKLKRKDKLANVVLPVPIAMGMEAAISITTKVLTYFSPEYIFMVGICAGNRSVTKIGDIIIAEKSLNYNEIVETEKKDETQVKKFMQNADSINRNLKTRLTLFSRKPIINEIKTSYLGSKDFPDELSCKIGLMVSGSSLVRSETKIEEINSSYHNVKALDMETHGFYFASCNNFNEKQPLFVSIKSVSDFGDNTNHKISSDKRKEYALHTSTQALIKIIEKEI